MAARSPVTLHGPRRGLAVVLATVLALSGCRGGSADRTDAAPADGDGRAGTAAGECVPRDVEARPLPDGLAGAIPPDEDVVVTELDNGLTVYVRENDSPGGRAQLGLVVAAGSAQEGDDQSGVAHFLEHMLFNGTERWPGNALLPVLERFGTQIGPDLNAFTDYDATQYWLEAPTTDDESVALSLDVLREWTTEATLAPDEVTAERGVVAEEIRAREEGADGRIQHAYEELVFAGSPYEGRSPGGDLAAVESMTPDALVPFYEDRYQPQLMAIVAVGDFDGQVVLDEIEDRFDDVPTGDTDRPDLEAEPWSEPRYAALVEPEVPVAEASLFFPLPPTDDRTGSDRRAGWLRILAFDLLATRLRDDLARGDLAITGATASTGSTVSALALPSLDVEAASSEIGTGVRAGLEELERACRFGFSDAEFDRVIARHRSAVDEEYTSRASRQDQQYAFEYATAYLEDTPLPDAETDHRLDRAVLDAVTPDEVWAWFSDLYADTSPSIFAAGPDGDDLPSSADLEAMAASARDADLEDRTTVEVGDDGLMERPDPVEVVERDELPPPFDGERVTYGNGVQVVIGHSDIHRGHADLEGVAPGGLSVLADEDVAAGQILGTVLGRSGVGPFDQVALETVLADRDARVQVALTDVEENVCGSAAVDDLETMLQLVHLSLTEPRATDAAVTATVSELLPLATDPSQDPETAAYGALLDARFDGEPRYTVLPGPDGLDAVEADQVRRLADEQLGQTGDLVFALVGDFDTEQAERLAASYLGTLPSTTGAPAADRAPDPPSGVVTREVVAGTGDQGRLLLLYTVLGRVDFDTEITLEVLRTMASTRLREVIREDLSATYAATVRTDVSREPDEGFDLLVDTGADPDRLTEVSDVARSELGRLAAGDFTEDELERARAAVVRDYELWDNGLLLSTHLFHARHREVDYDDFLDRSAIAAEVRADQVTAIAAALFAPDRYLEVLLRPQD